MHVIFLAPHFPAGQRRFVRGLKNVGARVTGIGDMRPEGLDSELRGLLGQDDEISAEVQRRGDAMVSWPPSTRTRRAIHWRVWWARGSRRLSGASRYPCVAAMGS